MMYRKYIDIKLKLPNGYDIAYLGLPYEMRPGLPIFNYL